MRNIVWQVRERILTKEKPPLKELVRTFWYMYIKPTLARVGALTHKTDQYDQLVDTLVFLTKEQDLMHYKDIGFRDDNRFNRKVGLNANVILFSEKVGHQDFLAEIAEKYQVSILALGGQPSVMNIEYFVDDLKKHGVNLRRSFFLFSIVDYDTSGWIIRDAFIDDLVHYGIKNINCVDLINPDMLSPDEILAARYPVPISENMRKKNTAWLREIKKMKYNNQEHLDPKKDRRGRKIIYGLEAESVSSKRLEEKLDVLLPPFLGKNERLLKIMSLEKLNQSLKDLILFKLT
ncbi:MAG: hypothetical protein P9L90_02075 [Candidatus Aadella gelida]|nr:hypothetical protein [Candidatus Aadella gelida]